MLAGSLFSAKVSFTSFSKTGITLSAEEEGVLGLILNCIVIDGLGNYSGLSLKNSHSMALGNSSLQ